MKTYYVSPAGDDQNSGSEDQPWQTLHRIGDRLRGEQDGEDILIQFAAGTHRLHEPLILGPEQGGGDSQKVTFRGAAKGETVISSGRPIDGWARLEGSHPDVPAELNGKVWFRDLPEGTKVNALYQGKSRLPRAQGDAIQPQLMNFTDPSEYPDAYGPNGNDKSEEWFQNPRHHWRHDGFSFKDGAIRSAGDLAEAECLIIPRYQWTMNVLPVAKVDFEKCYLQLAESCTYPIGVPGCAKDGSIWLENSLSVLTPGSWVYHASSARLYYCPEGDEPESGIEAATLTEFIRLEGECDLKGRPKQIKNVHFENLVFTHSNRFSFHGLTGKGIQHDWEMHDAPSSMVRLRHAKNCSVVNCRFEEGSSGGVRLDLACQGNRIEGNTFSHLGSCGVLLCGYGPSRHYLNRDNVVADNHIHDIGESYWHCPAIFIWQSGNNHIARNHLHDLPYTGIVCSGRILYDREGVMECSGTIHWGDVEEQCGEGYVYNIWWYSGITDWQKREPLLHSRDNLIEYNHIHDVMLTMGDGNGIYVSGAGGGNVVRFNAIGPCPSPRMAEGLRCDDDQHHTILHGNLVFSQGGDATGITLKGTNRVTNNILALPVVSPHRGMLSLETGPINGSVIRKNIILTSEPDQKPVSEMRYHGTGRKARQMDTDSDQNLYYCTSAPESSRELLEKIQSFGTDDHSQAIDPHFEDAEGGDFRFKPNSPALKMGIRALPLEKMFVGKKKG